MTDSSTRGGRNRREANKQRTKSELTRVALELFARKGYDATSVTEIVNAFWNVPP